MVTFKEAVRIAKDFLTEYAGLYGGYLELEEIEKKDAKWTIKFRYLGSVYEVTVEDETRDVVGFKKLST